MQIRLTVLGSRSGHQTAPAGCDVLVTAPVGTALAAVASGLAATVGGPDTGGTVVLYAGRERLDLQRRVLGEPPLVDGAVLGLHAPVPDVLPDGTDGTDGAQLHVVAGPDAGGVHLLHPGAIRIGRSADADVPLDDPDVSRLHCAVTVMPDGRVAVADLDSTNGTTVDGAAVGPQPVALAPGALLRIGESTLRLAPDTASALPVVPDLEGHLSLAAPEAPGDSAGADLTGQVPVTDLPLGTPGTGRSDANASGRPGPSYGAPGAGHVAGPGTDRDAGRDVGPGPESGAARPGWSGAVGPGPDAGRNGRTGPAYGTSGAGRGPDRARAARPGRARSQVRAAGPGRSTAAPAPGGPVRADPARAGPARRTAPPARATTCARRPDRGRVPARAARPGRAQDPARAVAPGRSPAQAARRDRVRSPEPGRAGCGSGGSGPGRGSGCGGRDLRGGGRGRAGRGRRAGRR